MVSFIITLFSKRLWQEPPDKVESNATEIVIGIELLLDVSNRGMFWYYPLIRCLS